MLVPDVGDEHRRARSGRPDRVSPSRKVDETREGVDLTNLDQPLFDGADATKRDLVDYLDAISDRLLPELRGRPLSVIRVHRGKEAFMQKNVPKHAPDFVKTVAFWAEASKREVSYALCDDRRTLLWFANQRAGAILHVDHQGLIGRPLELAIPLTDAEVKIIEKLIAERLKN